MIRSLGVRMNQPMELGQDSEGAHGKPERQHHCCHHSAEPAPVRRCHPRYHAVSKKHIIPGEASKVPSPCASGHGTISCRISGQSKFDCL
jgi:hypothetical protein